MLDGRRACMTDAAVVVGCGSIGRRHALNLRSAGMPLLLVDSAGERSHALASEVGGRACATLEEALAARPKVVFVCAPTSDHLQTAVTATEAGCHLFIEKPVADRLDGLDRLGSLVASQSLVAMVGCNMRFHPGPAAIKAALDRNEIGEPLSARVHTGSYLPSWRPAQDYRASYSASRSSGGAILDCIHEIDLAQWYLGPAKLHAALVRQARTLGLDTDGLAELLLTHVGGCISSVHLNFVQRDYSRSCLVIGTEGTLEWSWRDAEVRLFDARGTLSRRTPLPPHWDVNDMYRDELQHFLGAVSARQQPMNAVEEASRTLRIALEARALALTATPAS